ncbi:MAG: D-alanyl-D-alanine carboxypeptidase family protein [Rubrobacteraceae bacterium]
MNFRSIKTIVLAASLALVFLYETEARAQETTVQEPVAQEPSSPSVGARAWTLMDIRTGEYLAGKNAEKRLPMASTTKIMLALVTLEDGSLNEEVIISKKAASYAVPLYSNVGLFAGDTVSVRELLMASIISSGDDAAYALAEHLGDGSVNEFVGKMNRRADELGLEDTNFENPVGFDARDHYSSARDLAQMTRGAFENPEFREIVATAETAITTQDRTIPLVSTNDLLFTYELATGVKTGTTPDAGPSLVASGASGNESYITVVLDDEERFSDTITLMEHGFGTYDRRNLAVKGKQYARANVPYRRGEKISVVARNDVPGLVDEDPRVEREVALVEEMPGVVRAGDRLGDLLVKVDGERVGEKVWDTVEGIFE